jgi:hypothetical protein
MDRYKSPQETSYSSFLNPDLATGFPTVCSVLGDSERRAILLFRVIIRIFVVEIEQDGENGSTATDLMFR